MAEKEKSTEISRRVVYNKGEFYLSQVFKVTGWSQDTDRIVREKELSDDTRRS